MLTIEQITIEAKKFRILLESNKNKDVPLLLDSFPIMSCKLTSLLFCYHILYKWKSETIYGVCGFAKNKNREETISHYWLEINDIVVDLTADQYNLIDDNELNKKILQSRPFKSIYIGKVGTTPQYKIFRIHNKDEYVYGLPTLSEDFIDNLKMSYKKLGLMG